MCRAKEGLCFSSLPLLAPKLPLTYVHAHSKSSEKERSASPNACHVLLTLFRFPFREAFPVTLPQNTSNCLFCFTHVSPSAIRTCICLLACCPFFCNLNLASTGGIVYFVAAVSSVPGTSLTHEGKESRSSSVGVQPLRRVKGSTFPNRHSPRSRSRNCTLCNVCRTAPDALNALRRYLLNECICGI